MKKNAWIALLLSIDFIFLPHLFSVRTAQAKWNMAKSIKELIAGKKQSEATNSGQEDEKNTAPQEQERQTRFKDNGNGTLTDTATGLIWLKNANCAVFFAKDKSVKNSRQWHEARMAAYELSDGFCGLSDKSKTGDWRLPERAELLAIARHPEDKDNWAAGEAFHGIQSFYYWSSSIGDLYPDFAFYVSLSSGMDSYAFQLNSFHVLPVRGHLKLQQDTP